MRRVFALFVALICLSGPAAALDPLPSVQPQDAPSSFAQPNENQLAEHGHYRNRSGRIVHSPAHSVNGAAPTGATAKCRDGTFSFSQHHSGTCSGHHGVDRWLGN